MNNPTVTLVVNFIIKWVCVGIVIHFGLKFGAALDGALTFI